MTCPPLRSTFKLQVTTYLQVTSLCLLSCQLSFILGIIKMEKSGAEEICKAEQKYICTRGVGEVENKVNMDLSIYQASTAIISVHGCDSTST